MMVSMMLPLLVAGGFGVLRLLCKYGVRRYIQRALDSA
jgi:hypothetical protein